MITATKIKTVKRACVQNPVFSILIPTWNNLPYLQLCINSIRKNSTYLHQIVVHINEGTDGTHEWLSAQTDIDYTYSEENIGVCYALNSCRSLASADYLVYINDDMYTCPGWDKVLNDEIEIIGHNNFFLSSTAIEPRAQSACSIEKNYGTDISSFDEARLLEEFALIPMDDWQGATWPPNIVHKDIWDLAGGYSIEFSPGMFSDPDFSMKLWKIGIRLFKGLEKSRVYHFGSVSLKRVKKNRGYYTFIAKWAITQNIFSSYFLRRGQRFDGPLADPALSTGKKLNNLFKQFKAILKRD
jgi:glycosyltransferase involved in cell wall biosynthesis